MQLEQNFSDGRTDGRTDGQEFPVIDLIKFLCAILVVVSHVPPLESFTANAFAENLNFGMIHYLARIAVPFYFSAAGFFLFRKINFDSFDFSVFRNYIFKNLRLLGLWSVLLFAGGTGHLWFMGGLFVAVCLLGILLHYRVSMRKMAVLAIVLYAIGLIGDSYYGILVPLQNHKLVAYAISGYEHKRV